MFAGLVSAVIALLCVDIVSPGGEAVPLSANRCGKRKRCSPPMYLLHPYLVQRERAGLLFIQF